MSTFNENGLLPLMVDPMHFVVPAHAEKRVNIEFVPDRTNTEYGGDLELSWGGKVSGSHKQTALVRDNHRIQ